MEHEAIRAACERLEEAFGPRAITVGASGVGAWGNSTSLGFEVRFGERGGRIWQSFIKYARRRLPVFWPAVPFQSVEAAEEDLRREVDEFLSQLEAGKPPPARGVWLGFGGSRR
jgi:hypothetical protein